MKTTKRAATQEQKEESRRISLKDCRKILNKGELTYTDEEILKIRDFMYCLAAIGAEELEGTRPAKVISLEEHQQQTTAYEECHYLRAG